MKSKTGYYEVCGVMYEINDKSPKLTREAKGGYYEYGGDHISIQRGCEINCRYCYAKWEACKRWKQCTEFEWPMPIINQQKIDAKYLLFEDQPIMFPSRHDITTSNMSECIIVLKKLLEKGNRVVIVSKPHWNVIPCMAEALRDWQKQITFRFTIGSVDDKTLEFWEPGAAGFEERLRCLQYCFNLGYSTSVSCEPYLDGLPYLVYETTIEFINESFWLGKMNKFESRVDQSKISQSEQVDFVKPLLRASTKDAVRAIYGLMKDRPLMKFKDSIRKIVGIEEYAK